MAQAGWKFKPMVYLATILAAKRHKRRKEGMRDEGGSDAPYRPWSGSRPSTLGPRLFEDENPSSLRYAAAGDGDELSLHWLMCTTVAGGKPLNQVEDAWL
jgi:hypothetical protein